MNDEEFSSRMDKVVENLSQTSQILDETKKVNRSARKWRLFAIILSFISIAIAATLSVVLSIPT